MQHLSPMYIYYLFLTYTCTKHLIRQKSEDVLTPIQNPHALKCIVKVVHVDLN